MSQLQANQLAEEANAWLLSKNGSDQINEVIKEVRIASHELQKARELKPESLNQPVTL